MNVETGPGLFTLAPAPPAPKPSEQDTYPIAKP
ncbi:hypothetical protein IW245_000245 [Longispora fulva]|uniref:Uncharacterized protein n=1 Tax=Longispora fulva TaxID=619741 RepID=A0A8J7GAZ3_9ACTN|nr:hypothetical protein [Longispora fulva]